MDGVLHGIKQFDQMLPTISASTAVFLMYCVWQYTQNQILALEMKAQQQQQQQQQLQFWITCFIILAFYLMFSIMNSAAQPKTAYTRPLASNMKTRQRKEHIRNRSLLLQPRQRAVRNSSADRENPCRNKVREPMLANTVIDRHGCMCPACNQLKHMIVRQGQDEVDRQWKSAMRAQCT